MAYTSIGVNNGGAGDSRALFMTRYNTDCLQIFNDQNIMKPLVTVKSITSGKAEAFDIVGNIPVEELTNTVADLAVTSVKTTQRTVTLGNIKLAKSWLSRLDQALVHYDAKNENVKSIGRSLAKQYDTDAIATVIIAAKIKDLTTAGTAGLLPFADDKYTAPVFIAAADVKVGAKVYAAALDAVTAWNAAENVGSPVLLLRNEQYSALLHNPAQTGLTWVDDPYSQSGKVPHFMGVPVMQTARFPAVAGAAGDVYGLLFSRESVGCLSRIEMELFIDEISEKGKATLMQGQMLYGFGVLNHACAISIEIPAAP